MTWLEDLIACTAESEAPERYFWWSGVSAISAVCRRNIFLNRFFYVLYPNLFTLLIGPSGMKKSVPVGMAEKLVRMVDSTRVYSGRGSIQGIIKDLGKIHTHKDKRTSSDAKCFVVSGEFDSMLVNDEHAYSIITDLYDTHWKDKWRNIIKTSGTDELTNIYMVILGASNEDNLAIALPKVAERGGFVARTVIVLEEKEKCSNPLTKPPKIIPDLKKLSKRLGEITNIQGEFRWDDPTAVMYEKWYEDLKRIAKQDPTGTLSRLGDTVLKVAMCISLSKKDDLILCKDEVEEAIMKCEECIPDMKRVFLGHGKHASAEATAAVLKLLLTRNDHQVTRRNLLVNLYGIADAMDLDRIIDTLTQSGALTSERVGTEIVYKMADEVVQKYRNLKMKMVN